MTTGDIEINEIDQSQFTPGRGAIMAVVGPASKGVIGKSRLLNNESDMLLYYGAEYAEDPTITLVRQALKGGSQIRFSRSVHLTDINDPLTKTSLPSEVIINGPAAAAIGAVQSSNTTAVYMPGGSILNVDVDGVVTPVPFQGNSGFVTSGGPEPWNLTGGRTLTLKVDQGVEQTINIVDGDFLVPGAATATELATALNDGRMVGASATTPGGTLVRLTSDTRGSDSYIQVTGGTLNVELGWPTTEQGSLGPDNVPDMNSVSAFDLYNVLIAAAIVGLVVTFDSDTATVTLTTVATGLAVYLGFSGAAGVPEKFGFVDGVPGRTNGADAGATTPAVRVYALEDGTWADTTSIVVSVNLDDPTKFNFLITPPQTTQKGVATENITGIDKDSYPTTGANWGFEKLNDVQPDAGGYVMAGGDNGISGMTAATRVGSVEARTGIYGLDQLDYIDLFIPTMTDNAQQIAVKNWGEATGVHYVPSIPVGLTPQQGLDFARAEGAYSGATRIRSSYVSYQFGDLEYVDPLVGDGATTAFYDPAGGTATVYAYNDLRGDKNGNFPGPWLAPSGRARGLVAQERITRPKSVSYDMAQQAYSAQRTAMRNSGVNFFEVFNGEVMVKGNRTTSADNSKLRFLNVRRLLLAIRRSLTPILLDLIDEPLGPPMWRAAHQRTSDMLQQEYADKGAFQPGENDPGFLVNCDQFARTFAEATLNKPQTVDQGQFIMQIRVKPRTATEYIIVNIIVDSAAVQYDEQI